MRIHGLLFLLVMLLTEVAWTKAHQSCRDWDPGKAYKLALEDEQAMIWGTEPPATADLQTHRHPTNEFHQYRPPTEKPKVNWRERSAF